MATIKYNGMELEELNPDKTIPFNPPIKCVGWNNKDVMVEFELSCALSKEIWHHRFIGKSENNDPVAFRFCALLPEKPAPRMATNRELAKWLAQGYGEWKYEHEPDSKLESNFASINYHYEDSSACNLVSTKTKVRKWDDSEWHTPDVEYMGIADVTTFEDVVKREG